MSEILFTIITVSYNSGKQIRKTIESVLFQTYPHIEYLIIDGGSTDTTVNIAEEYRCAFQKKRYQYTIFSEPDNGIYDAMNKGIKRSSGEIIGFINAGDWYEGAAVETAAVEYSKGFYDYFFADINLILANGGSIVKHSRNDLFPTSRHWNHPTGFATRRLYRELGGFKCKGIHDDFEFFLRVRKAGKKISIKNTTLANFRIGGISNEKSLAMCRQRVTDRYKSYRANGYSPLYFLECIMVEAMKYLLCR